MMCVAEMKGQRFTFTIEPDLYEPLKAQARKERRSIGSLLNWLAARYLEEQIGIAIEPSVQHGGDRKSAAIKGADKISGDALLETAKANDKPVSETTLDPSSETIPDTTVA